MDEIALFTAIAPSHDVGEERQQLARTRLAAAMSGPSRASRPRRRPLVLAAAAATVVAVAAGALLAVGRPSTSRTAAAVHVNLAAWSVNTSAAGTVTFVVKEMADSAQLEHVLSTAGVPAVVRFGENCRTQGQTLPLRGVVSGPKYVGGAVGRPEWVNGRWYPDWAFTITPSAMPRGSTFMISVGPGPEPGSPTNYQWFHWALVPLGEHVTCGPSVAPVVG
jgi:hypothetical protein